MINFFDIFLIVRAYALKFVLLLFFSLATYGLFQFLKWIIKADAWRKFIPYMIYGAWLIPSCIVLKSLPQGAVYALAVTLLSLNVNAVSKAILALIKSVFKKT